MFYRAAVVVLALGAGIASAAPSFAMTGAGCPDLPEYDRALGTVENGAYSCGMSMEEARRILARGENGQGAVQPAAPVIHVHRKHHHLRAKPHL